MVKRSFEQNPPPQPNPLAASGITDDAPEFVPAFDMRPSSSLLGDASSRAALARLDVAADHARLKQTLTLLKAALTSLKKSEWQAGAQLAIQALEVDEKSGEAWHILAISREKSGDLAGAFACYEAALKLMPNNVPVTNDLGRLAVRMEYPDIAEKFFTFVLRIEPDNTEAANNLATALREASRYEDAIEVLRTAIGLNPQDPQLWNALGTVVNTQGDVDTSIIFYQEALKFNPKHVHALYNLGNALGLLGHYEQALEHLMRALPLFDDPLNIYTCRLSITFINAVLNNFDVAWDYYDGRIKEGTPEKILFLIDRPKWTPDTDVAGKHVLVSAEQGLGDEVLFASLLPDLIRDIGPDGKLTIAVEPRLVSLFARSFPNATVIKHHTTKHKGRVVRLFPDLIDAGSIDCWAMMGDLLKRYRRSLDDFPAANVFLTPDPDRVAYWRAELDKLGPEPKAGILWKSLIKHSRRDRYYSPFETWKEVIATEGVTFVNLQYGDVTAELAEAEASGLRIWNPPGIDLKADLDDLCALCCALDTVMGPSNATSNIAAGAGATIWMSIPFRSAWLCLGTDHYPFYPTARVFAPAVLNDWGDALGQMKQALIDDLIPAKTRAQAPTKAL
ncbi:tetratricopeptide repeat protein [Asticcacaulis sp. ZE23SCel15]|uniref:tetratricopeptide repeat protein n=1 Tax=Asticcacaulis sp. ZE23SCel15 TaxID=3059027 RepID=UPI00265FA296|nr:tetratricopeptide repeat protein [Asticcacaulis sp. ZE23SCel15]WKL56310.1 tetratricopeptide repeat protein [Asticcacaulis sp. ZE23SCel15]